MPTTYTSFLGLALPATGELSGTWGTTVNSYISEYLDSAVAGVQTISGTQTAVALSVANGASLVQAGGAGATGSAQYMIINCTGTPASLLTISAPNASKVYVVINGTAQSVKLVGVTGPTAGVTLVTGEKAVCAWNGSDFVKVATSVADGVTSVAMTVPTLLSVSGSPITSSGTLALTYSGTALPVANGGTGLTAGTSGGVLAYTASGTLASSTALAASALVIGGGAGAAPSTTTTGTGVVTALGVNTGTAGAFVVNGGALGSPSTAGTIPAFTLGGTVSGGGNQINNVVIGTSTPLAGSFTTLNASGLATIGNASGQNGVFDAVLGSAAATTGDNSGVVVVNNATGTGYLGFNNANNASIPGQVTYNHSTNTMNLYSSGPITFQPSGGTVSTLSSTGLTVTGTLTATGASTLTGITSIGGIPNSQPTPTGTLVNLIGTGADSTTVPQARLNLVVGTNQDYSTWIGGIHGNSIGTDPRILLGSRVVGNDILLATFALATATLPGTLTGGTSGTGYSFSGSAPANSLTLAANANLTLNNGECFTLGGKTYSVGTSATSISATHSYGSTAMIRGDGGSGILFSDLVFFSDSVVTVLASQTVSSAPAARTYSAVGGILKLAMASGTYTVNVGITTLA